ncbi:MAG: type II toxin-antitoxin system VapC family toxin [bacterium]|nr:type II toxin-antitoxin system VapC family toxin [bacterium]
MSTAPIYLDTSAVLRAWLETGTSPEVEARLLAAPALVTSRLALVESARVMHRVRSLGALAEARLADAERGIEEVWARCDVWELTREVCDLARTLAPSRPLRALDALHLATFVVARRRIEGLEMLTTDGRLAEVSGLV